MKVIEYNLGKILLIPQQPIKGFYLNIAGVCVCSSIDFKPLGMLSRITDDKVISVVESHPHTIEYQEFAMNGAFIIYGIKQYKNKARRFDNATESAKLSFISLLESHGVDLNKDYFVYHISK